MDSSRGKQQYSFNNHKKASNSSYSHCHENNNYSTSSGHGIFRTSRIQRHSLKWRKDHHYTGNHRCKYPYRKSEFSSRKSSKPAEDVEEDERKKKLTDTANKLLSKIKTWNAEKSCNQDSALQSSINEVVSNINCKHNEEKTNSESKSNRIAHSKKTKVVKNTTSKSLDQANKTIFRYDVNKETVKDFQNRIQHKLIEEIMQMPKENLQSVLNDPKINPIMELKMSRLVKENKPLIAQKLRALAESKMKSLDSFASPQFLVDIDKLIDPVIETDLSVLPYEIIKQMENVFQVKFDYSQNNAESQIESDVCDSEVNNMVTNTEEIVMEANQLEQNVKTELNEDLSLYECTTDEDEEDSANKSIGLNEECILPVPSELSDRTQGPGEPARKVQGNANKSMKKRNFSKNTEALTNKSTKQQSSSHLNDSVNKQGESPSLEPEIKPPPLKIHLPCENLLSSQPNVNLDEKVRQHLTTSPKELISTSCQTDLNFENASTQTLLHSEAKESLCEILLRNETTDESMPSLLEEVKTIQNLINKLNEKRLMLFLQMAKMNPSGSFIGNDDTEKNFIETISNGNLYLIESLKKFFTNHQRKSRKPLGCRSSEKWSSTSRSGSKEHKKSRN